MSHFKGQTQDHLYDTLLPEVGRRQRLANAPGDNDAGSSDPYSGLDRFGRVIDQNWFTIGGGTLDRNQYAYDADSNLLYDRDLGPTTQLQNLSELDGPYDALNRMTGFNIGHLNAAGTSRDSGASTTQSFGLNSVGVFQRSDANAPAQPTFQGIFTTTQMTSAMDASPIAELAADTYGSAGTNIASLSIQFDAWGNLSRLQQWNNNVVGVSAEGAPVSVLTTPSATSDASYHYDALGHRISEATSAGSMQLYYDAWGNVIEQRTLGSTSYSGIYDSQFFASTQHVFSPAGGNHLVLRDRNTGTGGNLGVAGSGMGERLYALRDAHGSTTSLVGVPASGNTGYIVERYLYQPSGSVTVLNTSGATIGIGSGASLYNWRYLYGGSRDDGGGIYYLHGIEFNSLTGLPLKEDPTAYSAQFEAYNNAVIASQPYVPSRNELYLERTLAWGGTALLTAATFGGYGFVAAASVNLTRGFAITGGLALAGGGVGYSVDGWSGAYSGSMIAMNAGGLAAGFRPQILAAGSMLLRAGDSVAADFVVGSRVLRSMLGGPPPYGVLAVGGPIFGSVESVKSVISAGMGGWQNSISSVGSTASTIFSLLGNDRRAIADLIESGAITPTTPYRAGFTRLQQHHVLPQEYREMFWQHGINIDEYCVEMDEAFHQAIHGGGDWELARQVAWEGEWNTNIVARVRDATQDVGRQLTADEIISIAEMQMSRYGIDGPFVQWRGAK